MKQKGGFLLMIMSLLIGLYVFCFNIIGVDFIYFPGDLGDGRLVMYFLEHSHKFFTGQIQSIWDAPFMYPEQSVLSYSENLIGSAPIYSLFRLIGLNNYLSYQLWFVVVSALNYISAFYFLKYIFKNNYAAILGAFVFAFSIALQSQLTHAQTFSRFAIPIAFLMVVKFSNEFKPKYLFFTLLLVVYQIYCGIYLGFMLAVPVGIYLFLILLKEIIYSKKIIYNAKWCFKIAASFFINVIILLPLMLPYMERKISPSFEHFKEISNSIPTIKSHFFSQEGSLIWDFLSKTGQNYEAWWNHQIFAGGIATICLLIGTYWLVSGLINTRFRLSNISTPLMLLLTGIITFFLYISFKGISAYIAIYFLPGYSSMRSITRIINIELIFFAIAVSFVFTRLSNYKVKYTFLLFLVALALIICDNYFYENNSYKTKVSIALERTDSIDNIFSKIPIASIVSYEPTDLKSAAIYYQIDAMLAGQKYNLTTINGYTATCPGDYGMYWNEPNKKSRNYWLEGKKLMHDTLYVIKSPNLLEKVLIKEVLDTDYKLVQEDKLQNLMNYIKTDKKWMKHIEEKALEKNVSLDSMVMLDAIWVMENEKK